MIYSIIPDDVIFRGWEEQKEHLQEMVWNGVTMQVRMISANQAQIVRLISPDPQHFLNPSYAPGQIVEFSPAVPRTLPT